MKSIPKHPWEMSLREWKDVDRGGFPKHVKARGGNILLYHRTGNAEALSIAKRGFDPSKSKSPPRGAMWAAREPEGYSDSGALVVFQVDPDDPLVELVAGNQAIVGREIEPKDILHVDPYYVTPHGKRLHQMRKPSRYQDRYWQWFQDHPEDREDVWKLRSAKSMREVTEGMIHLVVNGSDPSEVVETTITSKQMEGKSWRTSSGK